MDIKSLKNNGKFQELVIRSKECIMGKDIDIRGVENTNSCSTLKPRIDLLIDNADVFMHR